jgi:ABC-type lipoprotein release transport system permease subunit
MAEFFAMPGKVHEIAFRVKDVNKLPETLPVLKSEISAGGDLEVLGWDEVLPGMSRTIEADKKNTYFFLAIVALICGLVVLNTVLMSVLERTRELGILKALGTRPFEIALLVIYETFILSALSTVAGMATGILTNLIIQAAGGIPFGEGIDIGGVVIDTITARNSDRVLYLTPLIVFLTGIFVCIFPALRAASIIPVKAIYQR